jgi:hypothetical protein
MPIYEITADRIVPFEESCRGHPGRVFRGLEAHDTSRSEETACPREREDL